MRDLIRSIAAVKQGAVQKDQRRPFTSLDIGEIAPIRFQRPHSLSKFRVYVHVACQFPLFLPDGVSDPCRPVEPFETPPVLCTEFHKIATLRIMDTVSGLWARRIHSACGSMRPTVFSSPMRG